MLLKSLNSFTIISMFGFAFFILFFSGFLEFPSLSTTIKPIRDPTLSLTKSTPHPFTDLVTAFKEWDSLVGCPRFRENRKVSIQIANKSSSVQDSDAEPECGELKMDHVSVLVKGWTWIPDNLDNLYSCSCGLSCLWTKSSVLADKPDALLFETTTPPLKRRTGDPLRVYMELEAGRKRSGVEDLFVSYHAKDDVQSTYAGGLFHNGRNYHVSSRKDNDTLVYWSSSRCLPQRNKLAKKLLSLLPHHSFGKCLNNVGGLDRALSFYPECTNDANVTPKWWDHLHCAMSHYKFVLAIENTMTESYVTEKLFYALDSGSVPIYFGAPNVLDFVPPNSIIDGSKFSSLEELASYVRNLANDPIAYAQYHAWRRCGVLGNYGKTRAVSLDTLPCRLCHAVSRKGGRNA
ncbi:alpha-(1,4)-fucosyltransferase-like [Humulus lupulus]|uniref:alpha-(1,4)-fucosyltransferase-like n=1 Tax=Humulus lupulus TaxID=3486 RepID=UPI002B401D18|nr:alpha-(1,4)-fucosyltransferase-like [Humulus lupulus]